MKIAYIVFDYHRPSGMERVLSLKVNYLVNHGYDVSIITLSDKHLPPFFKFDSKIKFHDIGLPDDTLKYKKTFLSKLYDLLIEIKPDVTISTGLGISKYLYEVSDGSRKVLEIHFAKYKRKFEFASWDKYKIGRIITDIYSRRRVSIASKYDKFVVLTEEDKESWRKLSNIEVIPNPISFITKENRAELQNKKVIALGRYTYQKGFDKLIDIWAHIVNLYPEWKLSIYGHGRKKEQLESQIKKLGLVDSIQLNAPTQNIEEELMDNSIYLMTSRYEGFGLVLTEAMSCGLPVIAYACKCGPRDIISDGEDGFLIDTFDHKNFVNKLVLLIQNYDLRVEMGAKAKENIEKKFNLDLIMSKWIKLFNDLVIL